MNLFNKNLWEPLIGLWSIVHGLFGVLVALIVIWFGGSFFVGMLVTTVLATIWELLEVTFDGNEGYLNRIIDVILAMITYLITYYVYTTHNFSLETVKLSLWIFGSLFVIGSLVGWLAYMQYN